MLRSGDFVNPDEAMGRLHMTLSDLSVDGKLPIKEAKSIGATTQELNQRVVVRQLLEVFGGISKKSVNRDDFSVRMTMADRHAHAILKEFPFGRGERMPYLESRVSIKPTHVKPTHGIQYTSIHVAFAQKIRGGSSMTQVFGNFVRPVPSVLLSETLKPQDARSIVVLSDGIMSEMVRPSHVAVNQFLRPFSFLQGQLGRVTARVAGVLLRR